MPRVYSRIMLYLLPLFMLLVGCGGGSGTQFSGPPQGPYSNSSLNGSYVFAISGNNVGGPFNIAGNFTANGTGSITGGVEDINSPGSAVLLTNVAITGGSYTVGADGRGTATITSANGNITLDFVLTSTQSGFAIRFETTSTASGTLDVRNAAITQANLAGSFAFDLSGVDSGLFPDSNAGVFTVDATGNISAGVEDFNDSGAVATALAVNPGALAMGAPTNGRGTLAISSSLGTRHYAYYVIDANHLKLIGIDTNHILAGDSFRQQTTTVSGAYAYTLAGAVLTSGNNVFAAGGILTTDGAGNVVSATSPEDLYFGGPNNQNTLVTGTYVVTSGRGTMTLTGGVSALSLSFYPSTGGLLMLELDPTVVANGSALPQSGTPFSSGSISGTYGLNFTGVGLPGVFEVDSISQFTSTGTGTFTGTLDFNSSGSLGNNLALTGTYTLASNGRGTAVFNTSAGSFTTIFYMVSSTRAIFIELDTGEIAIGTFAKQQ